MKWSDSYKTSEMISADNLLRSIDDAKHIGYLRTSHFKYVCTRSVSRNDGKLFSRRYSHEPLWYEA